MLKCPASRYTGGFRYIVDTYFNHPNYYRVPTTLRNGTVAQCPYFAMYQLEYFMAGVGGQGAAEKALDSFRDYAESSGSCVHFVVMVAGSAESISTQTATFKTLDVASATSYCWMKLGLEGTKVFPAANYSALGPQSVAASTALANMFSDHLGIKYAPVVSSGWDSSPRTLPSDPFGNWGCKCLCIYGEAESNFNHRVMSPESYRSVGCVIRVDPG